MRIVHTPRSGGLPRPPRRLPRRTLLAVAVLALTPLTACGSEGSSTSTGSSAPSGTAAASPGASALPDAFPVTVTGANGEVTIEQAPEKIVVLGPTLTETLFAIGAGPQVVAVDDQSNHPADAPKTDLSAFQPNAEAVAKYAPDLVMVTNDSNGLVAALTSLKIPTLVLSAPTDLDGAYEQMATVGEATGHADDATKLATEVRDRIAAAAASVPASARGTKVYHELDPTFYSVTSSTFIGDVYAQFGLTNIADAAEGAAEAGGYPQLSAEYIVQQAPDLVVLADTKCCQQDLQALAKRPGFAAVPAVKNGVVLAADDDLASRWGPRIADFAEDVATTLGQLR
jgi:iron complex transport system substrate-binding protein